MVIHSRRKTERKPIVKEAVQKTGLVSAVEEPVIVAETVAASFNKEQVNKKPRKKKKRVVEE